MKILVFTPNWIGDVIFVTPAFEALKKHFKGAQIGCAIPARCKDIVKYNPWIDEIITFNERKEDKNIFRKIGFILSLRAKDYDMVFLLHRSFTRALLCALGGIGRRVAYAYKKTSFLVRDAVPAVNKDSLHKQDYYLNLLRGSGVPVENTDCRVFFSDTDKEFAQNILALDQYPSSVKIALNMVTNWPPKNWGIDNFYRLIAESLRRKHNYTFFLTSAESDPAFKKLVSIDERRVIDLSGQTTLLQLAAFYKSIDLVISGDSGPLHLAGAVGTKYIGIYGPTDPKLTGVRSSARGAILFENKDCPLPCYRDNCSGDKVCTQTISPEDVLETIERLTA